MLIKTFTYCHKILHKFSLLPLLLCLFYINGCKQDSPCAKEEPKNEKYYIDEVTKNKIPYNGLDTLIYLSDQGDTSILVGEKEENFFDVVTKNRSSNPECPLWDSYSYEHKSYYFSSKSPYLESLLISYFPTEVNPNYFVLKVTVNNQYSIAEAGTLYVNNESSYTDTVSINGIKYKGRKFDNGPKDSSLTILYNYHYGILTLKLLDSKIWIREF